MFVLVDSFPLSLAVFDSCDVWSPESSLVRDVSSGIKIKVVVYNVVKTKTTVLVKN